MVLLAEKTLGGVDSRAAQRELILTSLEKRLQTSESQLKISQEDVDELKRHSKANYQQAEAENN